MRKRLQRKKNTKERLLEATFQLISEKGYMGATTREIAARAGVTEITLFRHFGSKERLFEEVLQRYSFLPRLKEILPKIKHKPIEDGLKILAMDFINTLQEKKGMVKIMLSEMNVYPDKIRKVYDRFIEELIKTLSGYFDDIAREGKIRKMDNYIASRAFLGMIYAYFQSEEIIKGQAISKNELQRVVKTFVDLFLKGIA